mmetsp:Transcript_39568/g.80728  ORF Transcript_39568/g.80728 Transcript_39568/m.80728 type:complete len:176 (-) Transcript_39568:71-598(-)
MDAAAHIPDKEGNCEVNCVCHEHTVRNSRLPRQKIQHCGGSGDQESGKGESADNSEKKMAANETGMEGGEEILNAEAGRVRGSGENMSTSSCFPIQASQGHAGKKSLATQNVPGPKEMAEEIGNKTPQTEELRTAKSTNVQTGDKITAESDCARRRPQTHHTRKNLASFYLARCQ